MASTASSLVMGFAAHISPDAVMPFFRSLARSGYAGQTCLIAVSYSEEEVGQLRCLVDHLVVVPPPARQRRPSDVVTRLLWRVRTTPGMRRFYPSIFRLRCALARERNSYRLWSELEFRLEGLQSLRYGYYHDFLGSRQGQFDNVLISDIRDVVFQSDPFDPVPTTLELFLESGAETFADEGFNRRWLARLEGGRFADQAGTAVPSCSGTVIGPAGSLLSYLGAMRAEISWRRIPMGSHDQGVHNSLILKGRLPWAQVVSNEQGRVLTMGSMVDPVVTHEGLVTTSDGRVPAIVHQYDRFPQMARRIIARYAP